MALGRQISAHITRFYFNITIGHKVFPHNPQNKQTRKKNQNYEAWSRHNGDSDKKWAEYIPYFIINFYEILNNKNKCKIKIKKKSMPLCSRPVTLYCLSIMVLTV